MSAAPENVALSPAPGKPGVQLLPELKSVPVLFHVTGSADDTFNANINRPTTCKAGENTFFMDVRYGAL